MVLHLKNYIDGQFRDVDSRLDSYDPSTGEVAITVPDSGRQQVDEAVKAATVAFKRWGCEFESLSCPIFTDYFGVK